jgi:hypothetical protein
MENPAKLVKSYRLEGSKLKYTQKTRKHLKGQTGASDLSIKLERDQD